MTSATAISVELSNTAVIVKRLKFDTIRQEMLWAVDKQTRVLKTSAAASAYYERLCTKYGIKAGASVAPLANVSMESGSMCDGLGKSYF